MTSHRPSARTECLRCGIDNGSVRSEQRATGVGLGCVVTQWDGDREWPRHLWIEPERLLFESVVEYVEEALAIGHSTDQILTRFGIQYDSLVKRLRGSAVKARFQSTRREENYDRRYGSRY